MALTAQLLYSDLIKLYVRIINTPIAFNFFFMPTEIPAGIRHHQVCALNVLTFAIGYTE